MKKRFRLCFLLLALALFAVSASCESSGTCGANLTWTLDDAGTLTISGTGAIMDSPQWTFPQWDACPVRQVVIEEGVTAIGDWSLFGFSNVTSIQIPSTVVEIGENAVGYLFNLQNYTVSPNSSYFCDENGVLYSKDRTALVLYPTGRDQASYIIPNGVTRIGGRAFANSLLTDITIPEGVIQIGSFAFSGTNLASLALPASLTAVGEGTFSGGILAEITAASGNANFRSVDGVLFSADGKAIVAYPANKSGDGYVVPNGVETVSDWCFNGVQALRSIMLPDTVKELKVCAFTECYNLESINIPEGVTLLEGQTFAYCNSLGSITIPGTVQNVSWGAFMGCESLTSVTFAGNAPQIDDMVFDGVTATAYYPANDPTWTAEVRQNYGGDLTWVAMLPPIPEQWAFTLPAGLTRIGEEAFLNDTSLTTVRLSDNCTAIGANAFSGCSALEFVCIPNGSCTIADNAFGGNTDITIVTVPGSTAAKKAASMGLTVVDINS